MAINIDSLVQNEFGQTAVDQLRQITGKPEGQIRTGVNSAITEVLDGFSMMARDESGRHSLYEAARYSDDGLLDDPAVFFGSREPLDALGDSNGSLAGLVGIGRRDSIAEAVRRSADLSSQEADAVTGLVTPGILGVMKRQMQNGAVLDNPDGIGQMLLGDTTTVAEPGGARTSVDHTVPKTAPRQTHTQTQTHSHGGANAAAAVPHADSDSDLSWLFRWLLPLLLLGGLMLAGMRNCGVTTPVATVDTDTNELLSVQTELDTVRGETDGLKNQLATITSERDQAVSDRETAAAEIERLNGELETAGDIDTSELDAANAEIARLNEELAKPIDTSDLDAANAEIERLQADLSKPTDTSALDKANAEIERLQAELSKPADTSALDNANAEIERLQAELSKPADTSALDAAKAEVADLKNQLANVPEPVDNSDQILSLQKQVDNSALRFAQLESELGTVRESRDGLESSVAQLKADQTAAADQLAEAKSDLEAQMATAETAKADLNKEIESLVAERDKLKAEIDALNNDLETAKAESEELTQSAAGLMAERDGLQGDIDSMQAAIKKQSSLVTDAQLDRNMFRKNAAENEAALAKVKKGRSAAVKTVTDLVGKLRAAEAETASRDAEIEKIKKGRAWAMNALSKKATALRSAQADSAAQAQESSDALAKMKKGRTAAVKTVTDLVKKLRAAEAERDAVDAASKTEIAKLQKGRAWAMNALSKRVAALRGAESERDALIDDKQGLEQTLAEQRAAIQARKDEVEGVSASIANRLSASGVGNVSVLPVDEGEAVGISMGSSDLYRVGSATLSDQGIGILATVGEIVGEYSDWRIDVEGHTDAQPIGSVLQQKYPSNWELSTARAAAAVRYMESDVGIASDKMSARGFAETKPVASNETDAGREANRRIELILRR